MQKCYEANMAKLRNPSPSAKQCRNTDNIKAYLQLLKDVKKEK